MIIYQQTKIATMPQGQKVLYRRVVDQENRLLNYELIHCGLITKDDPCFEEYIETIKEGVRIRIRETRHSSDTLDK